MFINSVSNTLIQRLFCCLLMLLLWVPAAQAEKRIALVVGNGSYSERPLRNPVNDANLMQATLKDLGFEVQVLQNADRRGMLAGLRDFESRARDADVALFFYAGHGAQVAGNNYLIPVGGNIQSDADVPDEAVEAGSVLRRLEDARSKVALVILDACRDNPYAGSGRSSARGLVRMSVPTGTIVAYATASGSTADDGNTGNNGIYTGQLARQLKVPNLDIKDVFDRTAQEVERITKGKQRPREDIGLRGRFVLNARQSVQPGQPIRIASLQPEAVVTTVLPAQGNGLSLEDLEKEEAAQQQWAQWQVRMKADYEKTAAFAGSADRQVKAWDRFLAAWAQDNPLSTEDDTLRSRARADKDKAQGLAAARVPAVRLPANGGVEPVNNCSYCPDMVVIPAGRFTMGSNDGESNEKPPHPVTVRSFEMGKTEVTQGQWKAVMGSNPSRFNTCGDDCPVERVSWNMAQDYIRKLNAKSGRQYRLPSETEWEYAARARSTGDYWWGDKASHEYANYGEDECCGGLAQGRDQWVNTAPVGQFPANPFGLFDMHGNVWEWVEDVWHNNYAGAPTDGSAWLSGGDQARRVLRGGSWNDYPGDLRSAYRNQDSAVGSNNNTGFRLARTLLIP